LMTEQTNHCTAIKRKGDVAGPGNVDGVDPRFHGDDGMSLVDRMDRSGSPFSRG
jgi:hypothetical protein